MQTKKIKKKTMRRGQTDAEQIYGARKQLPVPSEGLSNSSQVVELVTPNSWVPCKLLGRKIKLEDRSVFSLHGKLAVFPSPMYPRALKMPSASVFLSPPISRKG